MADIIWKITHIQQDGELITAARYEVIGAQDGKMVKTEGMWKFLQPTLTVPMAEVTESKVSEWINAETHGQIVANLEKQLMASAPMVNAPWQPGTFKVNL